MTIPPSTERSLAHPKKLRGLHLAQFRPFRPLKHIRKTHPTYPLVNACPIHRCPLSWRPTGRDTSRATNTGHSTSQPQWTLYHLAGLPWQLTMRSPGIRAPEGRARFRWLSSSKSEGRNLWADDRPALLEETGRSFGSNSTRTAGRPREMRARRGKEARHRQGQASRMRGGSRRSRRAQQMVTKVLR